MLRLWIPNSFTCFRVLCSLLLFLPESLSAPFLCLYLFCGFSDILDGYLARKLRIQSQLGAVLDSLADLVFAVCALLTILPQLTLPTWAFSWMLGIFLLRTAAFAVGCHKYHTSVFLHTYLNKLAGWLLFCFPFLSLFLPSVLLLSITGAAATLSSIEELSIQILSKSLDRNIPSLLTLRSTGTLYKNLSLQNKGENDMLTKEWKQFKSGTDIRGVASDGVEGQAINLTDEVIEKMASGFALWLSGTVKKDCPELKVTVGHDSRISADRISTAVIRALTAAGVTVLDCGLASTPSMFMTTIDIPCDGAVQITASHHPFNRNGLKFFTKDGGLEGSDIEAILQYAQDGHRPAAASGGSCTPFNYMGQYSAHLRQMIQKGVNSQEDYEHPLKGFKIVVDAGNGAGGFYAYDVLAPLGADITGSQFLNPDGMFPNHIPNPENPTAMDSVCAATLKAGADMGVIFDTDVDRGGAVDSKGDEINRNRLVAIASAIALEGNDGGTIVTDSITSNGLKTYIETTLGGVHHRFKRGYKNVINEAIRLNQEGINCPLAIETSGHAALRENYFLDDGAYLVTKIIIKMAVLRKEGKTLDSLLEALAEPAEACEIRMPITEENFRACGEKILADLEAYSKSQGWEIAPDNREGLRVSFPKGKGDGWFLLRLSVHDPIMPLNIESDTHGGVLQILQQLYVFLSTCQGLDTAPAQAAIKA